MFIDEDLKDHLENSYAIESRSAVVAEWNMNIPGNIAKLGNYRYRRDNEAYKFLPSIYDPFDSGYFYTNATDSDITIDNGLESDAITPLLFTQNRDKEKLYFSLEDCLKPFRPRSGINKSTFFPDKYLSNVNVNMYRRPRYYLPHRDDQFKYWRSFRTESIYRLIQDPAYVAVSGTPGRPATSTIANSNIEYGISKTSATGIYYIDDACPFVVYNETVPANRIVLKVQTHVGSIDLGTFKNQQTGQSFADPFFGETNKVVPREFSVQYLNPNNEWIDAISFNQQSTRDDGTPIFGTDGYLNLQYGLQIPTAYMDNFILVGTVTSTNALPSSNYTGYAYLLLENETDRGMLYVYNGTDYDEIVPEYKWTIGTDEVYENSNFVTKLNEPSSYTTTVGQTDVVFREFVYIKGIRIVVKTMSKPNCSFDLIEMSPRLIVDISDKVVDFSLQKILSNLATSALPVGELMVSGGSLTLFDTDNSFNFNNQNSIVADHLRKNIKFTFYEVIQNVNNANYYVPLKTLYSQYFPVTDQATGNVQFDLRDFYFYFENSKAPQILLTEVSLSQAVAILLDNIGFSNYVFRRLDGVSDPVIPYFFIPPDSSVAEVLNQLAIATQSAMFFDEYNNFVVMTKEYLLDNTGSRSTDIVLYGSEDSETDGIVKNKLKQNAKPANIVSISASDRLIYNNGQINYTTRYIQKSYGSIRQAQMVGPDKTWIYKPVLLWEVSGTEKTTSENAEQQGAYVLGAYPLNANLSAQVPQVVNHQLVNTDLDLGDSVYFLTRFSGYLYANGEIIRYQSQEFTIPGVGDVQISSNLEYQKYFAELPFNGKIYPTGIVNIYAKPYYETVDGISRLKNGPVVEHGRGQFGTIIVDHSAGLDAYWSSNANIQGCEMRSDLIYTTEIQPTIPANTSGATGIVKSTAEKSLRTGIIKNMFVSSFMTETDIAFQKSAKSGSLQSSALVFTGPQFQANQTPRDFISYVYKPLTGSFKHFGTRVRVIGRVEAGDSNTQTPYGVMNYFNIPNDDPSQSVIVGGGSAGIGLVDPATNNGYFFEIAATSNTDLNSLLKKDSNGNSTIALNNVIFYKVRRPSSGSTAKAIPVPLWGGIGNIIVDDGNFTGQYRFIGEENPTVYDLSIEYKDTGSIRTFYLYINQRLVSTVVDESPIPIVNNTVALFVRGTTKAMFENIYALGKNYSENSAFDTGLPLAAIFGDEDNTINANEALNKYALSGLVQKTYLSNISASKFPSYNIYFEEFGTIMRECAYFNVKYDKAFPALYANLAPTFNRIRSYVVSGFQAGSYGAEFLIFNATDTLLNLDETTGNYLRILGNTFTQDTTQTLTVDQYYSKRGNLANPELKTDGTVVNPNKILQEYEQIRISRLLYGNNEFSLDSNYIQDQDSAENLLGWLIEKSVRPRKNVGMTIFSNPMIQLGDIVSIDYKNADGIDVIDSVDKKYIVYNIDYSKSIDGPNMTIYLSEV